MRTDNAGCMIWFFQRQQARLHYEIRRQTDGPGYELVVTHPDGRQEIEQYSDPSVLLDRSNQLRDGLMEAGWQPPHIGLRNIPRPSTGY